MSMGCPPWRGGVDVSGAMTLPRAPRLVGPYNPFAMADVLVRVARAGDAEAIASLRALWLARAAADAELEQRMAAWLAAEGDRRTTWLATLAGAPVGMASLFEYRRMPRPGGPDSSWGYVSNVFVREDARNRGIG